MTPRKTGKPTDVIRVHARFTDPLRRFSEYENIRAMIEGQARRHGDKTFLIDENDGREYSYSYLDDRSGRLAGVLYALEGTVGSRVAILMDNSPEYVFALLGVMRAGMLAVTLNGELDTAQLRFMLEDSGAIILITNAEFAQTADELQKNLPGLQAVLMVGRGAAPEEQPDGATALVLDYDTCLAETAPAQTDSAPRRWWDEAELVYTDAASGRPNGAILQHRQFMTGARWISVALRLDEDQRMLCALPLFHVNAQVIGIFTPLLLGASVVLSQHFSVSTMWASVERYRVTSIAAVPSMLGILTERELSETEGLHPEIEEQTWASPLESPGALGRRADEDARIKGLARAHDISSLQFVLCGGAPLPLASQLAFERCFLVPVIEGFSMAETTCFATLNPNNGSRKLGSAGVPVGNKVAIQDGSRSPKPLEDNWQPTTLQRMNPAIFPTANVGEPGEICVWGENVLKEYFRRPSLNPGAFAGGWFHTGDIGCFDSDGFLYVRGAKGERIVRDGKSFMPREIDELMFRHELVEQAATLGIKEGGRGDGVVVWIRARPGTFEGGPDDGRMPRDEQQQAEVETNLRLYLSQRLGEHKQPTTLIFTPRIPRDSTGKTRLRDLREMGARAREATRAFEKEDRRKG